jgi:pimeloyl-ACP methyl ester carboxylesterase
MSASVVTRHIVDIGDRTVHYRMAGKGFPVLLLHQSPRSSADMIDLMTRWAPHFLCIAPDTPGFGDSAPLAGPVSLPRLSDALAELIAALGLERVGLYGVHTGAILAVMTGVRHPDKVAALAVNGYGAWTAAERRALGANYAPPFKPQTCGAHLTWLWNRLADQRLVFPWNDWAKGERLAWGEATPAELHVEALDFLRAGDGYRGGYLAAFEADAVLPTRLAVPTLLAASGLDPLSGHLQRLGDLPSNVEPRLVATWPDAEEACRAFLAAQAGPVQAVQATPSATHRFVTVRTPAFTGRLHVGVRPGDLRQGGGAGTIRLHGPGESAATALSAAGKPRIVVFAPDLPGHGLSDPLEAAAMTPGDYGRIVAQVIAELGVEARAGRLEVEGLSSVLAEAVQDATGLQGALKPCSPPRALRRGDVLERWLPDLTPEPEGAHLLRAWTAVRRQAAFDPWYAPTPAHGRPLGDITTAGLAQRHLALLQAPGAAALLSACVQAATRD